MRLLTLGTGSKGNSYVLSDDDGNSLILDAGVSIEAIKKALDFNFQSVSGVLISHGHKDHVLCADALEYYGLDVWKPYVWDDGLDRITLGAYAVSSFPVNHDTEPCTGFLIRHTSGFRMIYATDLSYTKYIFSKFKADCILVECNYMDEYVNPELEYLRHKVCGHFSLKNCKEFIKVNQTDNLKTIILCHMSFSSCDGAESIKQIKEIVGDGVNVFIATPEEVVEL